MFKCLDRWNDREVVLLDEEWDDAGLLRLRALGRDSALHCPHCERPVGVKAGELRAWHFAHKASSGTCPLSLESAAVLKARGLLYSWLVAKFVKREGLTASRQASVNVEVKAGVGLPRPADCELVFPDGRRKVYWIFERGMRDRALLTSRLQGIPLQAVFLAGMLRQVPEQEDQFDLTPTERDFAAVTEYNELYGGAGGSLHYLDEREGTLTTLRGLSLIHPPQRHAARAVLKHPMGDILSERSGIFVHPGEYDALREFRARRKRIQHEQEQARRRERERYRQIREALSHPAPPVEPVPQRKPVDLRRDGDGEAVTAIHTYLRGGQPMTCTDCGRKTTDWIMATPAEGTCRCRDCVLRG